MPRKKSIGGRARGITVTSRLLREIEKANKNLNKLEAAREYGTYASRKLLLNVAGNKKVRYKRKSKNKFKIKAIKELTIPEQRLLLKDFQKFNKSENNTPEGIKKASEETIRRIQKGLGSKLDRKISKADAEDFYNFLKDPDYRYFADRIGASEMYETMMEAKSKQWSEDQFISTLEMYLTINNEDVRNKAVRLWNKYIG